MKMSETLAYYKEHRLNEEIYITNSDGSKTQSKILRISKNIFGEVFYICYDEDYLENERCIADKENKIISI